MDNILAISDLNLSFVPKPGAASDFLFRNLSLNVPGEEITALVGGNGVGKTTLFNVITGLQKGATGNILFNGQNISGLPPHLVSRKGIGRLFQGARVFEEMSILDNLLIGASRSPNEKPFYNLIFPRKAEAGEKMLAEKAEQVLTGLFGDKNEFLDRLNEPAGSLSYGQQRLLALARLLMGDYSLYLLDEPTSGVNVRFIDRIAAAVRRMNSHNHKTVLLIEHNMQFVRQMAENCLFMANGNILAEGAPAEVLDNEKVQLAYMGF